MFETKRQLNGRRADQDGDLFFFLHAYIIKFLRLFEENGALNESILVFRIQAPEIWIVPVDDVFIVRFLVFINSVKPVCKISVAQEF